MKSILRYISRYFYETDKRVLIGVSVFTAGLIFINYRFKLDAGISSQQSFAAKWGSRLVLFFVAFAVPYLLYVLLNRKNYFRHPTFLLLLFIGPALFSLKMILNIPFYFSDNAAINNYWNHITYWPLLLLIIGSLVFVCWRLFSNDQPFYGITVKNIEWKPYLIMLIIMIPLIAAASTQPDFLAAYPKLKMITAHNSIHQSGWHKLLFELSYGSDFVTIELFFRGFLILALIKWAGKDAILPMACFYCTIHFGKPLGECISSYFGGILLGIVVYHTRSIFGGLMVHLGIAWLMELGGYIALSLTKGI
ncbi:MAG TPA: CPBP family intramembrane glutamic endopeptidase [Chitinophagaceae bacterium]